MASDTPDFEKWLIDTDLTELLDEISSLEGETESESSIKSQKEVYDQKTEENPSKTPNVGELTGLLETKSLPLPSKSDGISDQKQVSQDSVQIQTEKNPSKTPNVGELTGLVETKSLPLPSKRDGISEPNESSIESLIPSELRTGRTHKGVKPLHCMTEPLDEEGKMRWRRAKNAYEHRTRKVKEMAALRTALDEEKRKVMELLIQVQNANRERDIYKNTMDQLMNKLP